MDYCLHRLYYCYGPVWLPDVSSHVHAGSTVSYCIVSKLQGLWLGEFLATCNYKWNRASFNHLFKVVAIVCLHYVCTKFCSNSTCKSKVTCITSHLLADCSHCKDRYFILFALIYQLC